MEQNTVYSICEILHDKRAENIVMIDISARTVIADAFVIASGRSTLQVQALCESLEKGMQEQGMPLRRREGYQGGRWIVLDFGDVMVHLFYDEERKFYNLERLWGNDTNMRVYPLIDQAQ